ncbi:Heme biosynthesis, partial [human gut metagenome]
ILSLDGRKEVNDNVRIKPDKSGSYDDIIPNIKEMINTRTTLKIYIKVIEFKFISIFFSSLHFIVKIIIIFKYFWKIF